MQYLDEKFGSILLKQWNGQNSLWFEIGSQNVFIDPFNLPHESYPVMDIVFISHEHFDHLNKESLNRVADINRTKVYAPTSSLEAVRAFFDGEVLPFDIGDIVKIGHVSCKAHPAYGIVRSDLHPKVKGWVSLVLSDEQTSVFITSDTERIPEFKELQADVILLPLGQRFTFTSLQEAIDTVLDVKAKVAIPVHHSMMKGEGTQADIQKFEETLKEKGVNVLYIEKYGEKDLLDEDEIASFLGL